MSWIIPPKQNSQFVAQMEQVLDVYKRPYDKDFPLVCMDESPKQMIKETKTAIPMKPGSDAKVDFEYERCGVANIFIASEPLKGTRYVELTERRTKMDWAMFISVAIMIWMERDRSENIPTNFWFGSFTGIAGGFTSMVGNLAGSVMALYFLSMRLPKNAFIGTAAWFFLVVNWFKVPFHVFVWHTITVNILLLCLCTTPIILLGGYLGVVITKRLSENSYRWFIIVMTLAAAVAMLM